MGKKGVNLEKSNIDENDKLNKDKKSIMNMDIKDIKEQLSKLFKKLNQPMNSKKSKTPTNEKKRNVVAFDIGTTTIKIVEGIYYKDKLSIDTCIQIKTPRDSIEDGEIKIRDAITTTIRTMLKQYNIKAKDAICTTNSTAIINREILIPKVEEEEMETVVRYEIQQYLPINLDECILQMSILNEFEDFDGKTKVNVRVIAYPKKMALEYYNLLTDLNLKPYALDVNFNALNKFVNITDLTKFEYKAKSSIALLDMGANFIDVNIYKDDKLDFTRRVKAGGNDMDETLIRDGAFEAEMVEKLKKEDIDLTEDDSSTKFETRLVEQVLDEWVEKIEMILQFYKNKSVDNDIEKVIIFGGSSKFKGLDKYMSDKLGIKVKMLKGVSNIAFKKSEDNGEKLSDFINAIGSVIRL
jgi:type IV pilus assembly protein PilM